MGDFADVFLMVLARPPARFRHGVRLCRQLGSHRSPWPSWHAHETVPVTNFSGMAQPWNTPTSRTLKPKETVSYAIRLTMAEAGHVGLDCVWTAAMRIQPHPTHHRPLHTHFFTCTYFI